MQTQGIGITRDRLENGKPALPPAALAEIEIEDGMRSATGKDYCL
jgi:hypothetical protein